MTNSEKEKSFDFDPIFIRLLQGQKNAKQIASLIASYRGNEPDLYELLKNFLMNKYLLNENDINSDNIDELTRISIEKMSELDHKLIKEMEEISACNGASSIITKKSLFFLSIQRDMHLEIQPKLLIGAKTIAELTEVVRNALYKKNGVSNN